MGSVEWKPSGEYYFVRILLIEKDLTHEPR